jgi:hypothetical protein
VLFIVCALGVGVFDVALMYALLKALLLLAGRRKGNKFVIRQSYKVVILLIAVLPFPLSRLCLSSLGRRDHRSFSRFGGIWLAVLLLGLAMWGFPLARQIKMAISRNES